VYVYVSCTFLVVVFEDACAARRRQVGARLDPRQLPRKSLGLGRSGKHLIEDVVVTLAFRLQIIKQDQQG